MSVVYYGAGQAGQFQLVVSLTDGHWVFLWMRLTEWLGVIL